MFWHEQEVCDMGEIRAVDLARSHFEGGKPGVQ